MTNKERIEQLEQEVAELRATVALLQSRPVYVPPNYYCYPTTTTPWWLSNTPTITCSAGVN